MSNVFFCDICKSAYCTCSETMLRHTIRQQHALIVQQHELIVATEAEVERLRPFEATVVCHWCKESWPKDAIPENHRCEQNPLVAALRQVAAAHRHGNAEETHLPEHCPTCIAEGALR